MNKSLSGAALLALMASTAHAEPAKVFRPKFEAPPEISAKYEALRGAAKLPVRRGDPVQVDKADRVAEGLFVSAEDGVIMLREKLEPARIEALKQRGVVSVARPEQIRSGVIFEDSYYVAYLAMPDADLLPLAGREGVRVRLVLVLTESMRYLVREVSVAPPR